MSSYFHTRRARQSIRPSHVTYPYYRPNKYSQQFTSHYTARYSGTPKLFRPNPTSLTIPAARRVDFAISNAWQDSTLIKYESGVKRFLAFCDHENIPTDLRLPASEFLLCAFAASTAGIRSGSTISSDLSAIRAWHIMNHTPYLGSLQLQYTLKGARNLTPKSSKRVLRPPVSWEMLDILVKDLNHDDPEDICVLACALAATSGQARLGELLPASLSSYNPSHHPSVSDLRSPSTAGGSRALHLPHTKTTGDTGATIFLCSQNDCTDPNTIIDKHLLINRLSSKHPLFSYSYHGSFIPLTKRRFLRRCNTIWSRYGLPTFSGHCFRIGGTTILLLRGVSPYIVKAMGRWTSDSFLKYWRSLEILAPIHAEFLAPYTSCILPPTKSVLKTVI